MFNNNQKENINMSNIKYKTREEYLQRAYALLNHTAFKPNGHECPPIKVACSWIVGTRASNKKTLGQCSNKKSSEANINEIRIVPTVDDSFMAIDTLAHEMAHAVDDCKSGHGVEFKKICMAVGLDGNTQMRYAEAGEKLGKTIKNIIATIGEYPHDKMNISDMKKQTTRNIKMECSSCGFGWRASRSMIERMSNITCNGCGSDTLEIV